MTNSSGGEMPFLDHLEELRGRLLRSVIVVVVCVLFGMWAAHQYKVIDFLQGPVRPYLKGGALVYFGLFDGIMIELKIGVMLGLVLASPVIAYQIWGFLSPALYSKEKRAVLPALFVGLGLFISGAYVAWRWLWPAAIQWAFEYAGSDLSPMLEWDRYWDSLILVVFSLGISMELPLVMTLLAWIHVMDSKKYASFRRASIVINTVVGAIIAPGVDPVSAILVAVPLMLLYEAGILGAKLVERGRRLRAARTATA